MKNGEEPPLENFWCKEMDMTVQIGWRGEIVDVKGNLPVVGQKAPEFSLTADDLGEIQLADFAGQNLVLNIFPSIDTPTCATSTRRFNEELASLDNTAVLCVSADPHCDRVFNKSWCETYAVCRLFSN